MLSAEMAIYVHAQWYAKTQPTPRQRAIPLVVYWCKLQVALEPSQEQMITYISHHRGHADYTQCHNRLCVRKTVQLYNFGLMTTPQ